MSKGAPDYTKLVSLKGRDAQGNDVSVLVDATGRILAVLQGAVEVTGTVNATPTTTVRQAQGHDGSQYRDLAVDTAGRMIALIKGSYGGVPTTVSLDDDGNLNARLKGKYGTGLLDVAVDSLGRMVVIDVTNQKQTNRVRAALDASTKSDVTYFGSTVSLAGRQEISQADGYTYPFTGIINYTKFSPAISGNISFVFFKVMDVGGPARLAIYTDSSGVPGTLLAETASVSVGTAWVEIALSELALVAGTQYWMAVQVNQSQMGPGRHAVASGVAQYQSQTYGAFPGTATPLADTWEWNSGIMSFPLTGSIKSNVLASTASLNLYWQKISLNLSKGGSTHASPLALKIYGSADGYAAALNANWVTIPEAEYASLLLERPVVKTATSNGQTVWNFTSLTGGDALINEIGAQYLLLLELAADGTNYVPLYVTADYTYNDTNRKAPVVTLLSGSGIVSGTSKLRATMVVDVISIDSATKNTSIKVQIQENRTAAGEASPTIGVLAWDATKYLEAYYVSGYW